jgi:Domain of unknown function (DUF4365)
MKRKETSGTANAGIFHVGKIVSACNSIFQQVDQQNDIGIDGYIEFTIDESATGCCIAVQIKSGPSYIKRGHFTLPANDAHFEYWRSHSLPVAGIVYDPEADEARWVDITGLLESNALESSTISVPDNNAFDTQTFNSFRDHFLAYRSRYADQRFLASALMDLAALGDSSRRQAGLMSLFSFHRQKIESWFYLISTLRSFYDSPLLHDVIRILCHVPGHMDIFWHRDNIFDESVRQNAHQLMQRLITPEDVSALLTAIDDENGIGRGSIGQCVRALLEIIPKRDEILEFVARDPSAEDDVRYWAMCLFVSFRQAGSTERCISLASDLSRALPPDKAQPAAQIVDILQTYGFVDFG